MNSPIKIGFIGIIGKPNVGKSTLLNQLIKEKISIVTPKPQTTRVPIYGILTEEEYQLVFIDTPGMLDKFGYELHKQMVKSIETIIRNSDIILTMVEPHFPKITEEKIIESLKKNNKKSILLINKIDLIEKKQLLPIMDIYSKRFPFIEIIPISAYNGKGINEIIPSILPHLKQGEPIFPQDEISDKPLRFFIAEILREKVFNFYSKEIPYAVAVEIEEWREDENLTYIKAIIYVEKNSQKGIIIGESGTALKKLGTIARKSIESFLKKKVYLDLWVKVREKWREDKNFLKKIGYIS